MADSLIGALRVFLGLDTAAFSQGTKEAQKQILGLEHSIKGLRTAMAGLSAVAFVGFLKSSTKVGEEIEKASDRLGISAEKYQELAYAADIAGVSHETLTNVLSKFQKGLGETSDNVTQTQKALGQLGLTLQQMKALKPDEQFALLADRLGAIEDPARRAYLGSQLMGKGYGELDVIMRLGSAGLAKFAAEARSLGFILSDETIKKAAAADDEFDKIGKALKVAGVNIAAEFLPVIKAVREIVTSPEFQQGVKDLAKAFNNFFHEFGEGNKVLTAAGAGLIAFKAGMRIGGVVGGAAAGAATFTAAMVLMEGQLKSTRRELQNAEHDMEFTRKEWEQLDKQSKSTLGLTEDQKERFAVVSAGYANERENVDKLREKVAALEEATRKEITVANTKPKQETLLDPEFIKKCADEIDKLKIKIMESSGGFNTLPEGFAAFAVQFKQFKDASGEFITNFAQLPKELQEVAVKFAEFNTFKLSDEMLGQWDKLSEKIQRVIEQNKLLPEGSKVAAIGVANLNKLYQQQMDLQLSAVQQGVSGFAQLAGEFAKKNKAMGVAAKAFGIAEVIISTARAVMKAYADLGPVFGTVAAAGMVAAGAAQVMKISSQQFAMGGSFMVPGGISATDNTFVPLSLASGEKVDITPAHEAQRAKDTTIVVAGISPKDYYKGDVLRDLVENLNIAIADGLKIKMV